MSDQVVELLTDAWWVYPLVAALVVGDCVLPVLPGETALITAGIIAADGGLSPVLLSLCGAAGAVAGDSLAYVLGRGPGGRLRDRLTRKRRTRERVEEVRDQLGERPWLVSVGRFVPGGRTAVAVTAGSLGMPFGRFAAFVAAGAVVWAPFNVALGVLGGTLFKDSFLLSLGASLAAAALLGALAELLHRRHVARA